MSSSTPTFCQLHQTSHAWEIPVIPPSFPMEGEETSFHNPETQSARRDGPSRHHFISLSNLRQPGQLFRCSCCGRQCSEDSPCYHLPIGTTNRKGEFLGRNNFCSFPCVIRFDNKTYKVEERHTHLIHQYFWLLFPDCQGLVIPEAPDPFLLEEYCLGGTMTQEQFNTYLDGGWLENPQYPGTSSVEIPHDLPFCPERNEVVKVIPHNVFVPFSRNLVKSKTKY